MTALLRATDYSFLNLLVVYQCIFQWMRASERKYHINQALQILPTLAWMHLNWRVIRQLYRCLTACNSLRLNPDFSLKNRFCLTISRYPGKLGLFQVFILYCPAYSVLLLSSYYPNGIIRCSPTLNFVSAINTGVSDGIHFLQSQSMSQRQTMKILMQMLMKVVMEILM